MEQVKEANVAKAPERKKKTAVVVIHGIGEQVPMDTLRSFVHTVWTTDRSLFPDNRRASDTGGERDINPTWSKPDTRNRSFELRRITTERTRNGRRCDFYEYYWADLMHGTTWDHVQAWLQTLLWRKPAQVPKNLFSAWILLWVISALVAIFVAYPTACSVTNACSAWVLPVLSIISAIAVGVIVNVYLLRYAGDAARYVSATPLNVGRRQEIREKGVELLEGLMGIGPEGWNPDSSEKLPYERIIVVGHSLGSIIGYDILTHAFARNNRSFQQVKMAEQPARAALEEMVRDAYETGSKLDLDAFSAAQDAARAELIAAGSPWIVSDFITLGSPLTHAEVLMAKDVEDLRIQQAERILPTCPPELERDLTTKREHFTYWPDDRRSDDDDVEAALTRIPHHAAHFGYTRWTNLYSPAEAIIWGDIISGPLAEEFGIPSASGKVVSGIKDVAVMTGEPGGRPPLFTHTKYWDLDDDDKPPEHVVELRKALDLARDRT